MSMIFYIKKTGDKLITWCNEKQEWVNHPRPVIYETIEEVEAVYTSLPEVERATSEIIGRDLTARFNKFRKDNAAELELRPSDHSANEEMVEFIKKNLG